MVPHESLVTSNAHVQYESPISSGKKVMAKVKVFVYANTRADISSRRLAKNQGFLLLSSLWSLEVVGQKLYSISCPQGFTRIESQLT